MLKSSMNPSERAAMVMAGSQADREGQQLEMAAEVAAVEQSALLATEASAQSYPLALADAIEAKQEQVDRLEGRLQHQVLAHEARLRALAIRRPGRLSGPGTRRDWQAQQGRQRQILLRLHGRLEVVREIRQAMELHGSRIETLAEQRLRRREPELAERWDALRAARRGQQALQRQQASVQAAAHGQVRGLSRNRSMTPP